MHRIGHPQLIGKGMFKGLSGPAEDTGMKAAFTVILARPSLLRCQQAALKLRNVQTGIIGHAYFHFCNNLHPIKV